MKKNIFIFAALIVSLWSCQKDLDLYSGRDFIYFNPSAGLDSTYFSFAYVDVNKEVDSLYIMVRTGGEVKDYDRKIQVRTELCKTDSVRAVEGVDFRAITKEVILPANCEKTSLQITMLRTEALRKYNRILTVVIEESEEFDSEFNWRKDSDGNPYFIGHSMTIISNEDFPKPWWWRDENDFFGKFSEQVGQHHVRPAACHGKCNIAAI